MTCLQPAKAGDSGDTRIVRLDGITNLSTVSSIAVFVKQKRVKATLTATVLDSAARTITVNLGVAPTGWLAAGPTTGDWEIEYQVTMANGNIITWPNQGHDSIHVYADLDPTPPPAP